MLLAVRDHVRAPWRNAGAGALPPVAPPTPGQPASVAPPGLQAVWWPMPLASGGYVVFPGAWYRMTATLSGTATPASKATIASQLSSRGWGSIQVFFAGDALPADWTNAATTGSGQLVHVLARRVGAQETLPAADTTKVWPVTIFAYVIQQAEAFDYQPIGATPPPFAPPGDAGAPATSSAVPYVVAGGVALAIVAAIAVAHHRREKKAA